MIQFQDKTQNNTVTIAYLAALAYLLAATGGIGVVNTGAVRSVIGIGVFLSLILIGLRNQTRFSKSEIFSLAFIFAVFLFQGLRTGTPDLAYEKLNGLIFGTTTLFLAARIGVGYSLDRFLMLFALFALVVLVLTIGYKLYFGFADRNVRFFINGPIVFGWMMGISSLVSIHLATTHNRRLYFAFAVAFLVAIVWSGSKGPLLAILPAIGILIYQAGGGIRAFVILSVISASLYVAYAQGLFPERFYVLDRLVLSQLSENDFGSIGSRVGMWQYSWTVFLDNPVFGTGLGNWANQINLYQDAVGTFVYPHNILMELLSEQGLFIATITFGLFGFFFMRSSALGRAIFLMIFIGLQFTGDASYWHLLLGFPAAFGQRAG